MQLVTGHDHTRNSRGVEAHIEQLHELDEGSYSFRYAATSKGEATLQGVERINFARFSEHMESLCNYLSGWDLYYKELLSNEAEVDDEMDCDYEPDGFKFTISRLVFARSDEV